MPRYKRVMLKLSGGAIAGKNGIGFDPDALDHIVSEVLSVREIGVNVGIVVGGGNIFRGNVSDKWKIERVEGDNIGMLGTVINSVLLRAALRARSSYDVRVMSAIPMDQVAEPFIRLRALRHLERGCIVILAGGVGQPYVTTDYPAVQRALQTDCDALLVAKQGVDGVYTADPKKFADAKRYVTIPYDEFVQRDLKIMDQSALLLARDHSLPVHIFNFTERGTVRRICLGEDVGTAVTPHASTLLAE